MFNSKFYKLCDELHDELIKYYGSRFNLACAKIGIDSDAQKETVADETNKTMLMLDSLGLTINA